MRPLLLGYLLDALEPEERAALEEQISRDPALGVELEKMRDALDPLVDDDEEIAAPSGLAQRTCHFVAARTQIERDASRHTGSSQWSMQDIGVAAGIFVAASMLFFPAVVTSRNNARVAQCSHNLATLGTAMGEYTSFFGGQLPPIEAEGNLARAGVYGPILVNGGYLDDATVLVCPASPLVSRISSFRVPSLDELRRATGDKLLELQRNMGGSYAYRLGYVYSGDYISPRSENRSTFPVLADAPDASNSLSEYHGCCGQNTLFEDGHVEFLKTRSCPSADGRQDDLFLNDEGLPAAGLHPADAVLGPSATAPLPALLPVGQ
ncbi:MAG: hypothetical protein R3C10_04645 [Pirellulales bacterium]|nr:hypothetical protein [Planctomycetales bacterium]